MAKRVVLGVTGSIAAYKAADIVSRLRKRGVETRVILTESGAQFITPLTLETLSANPVITDMFHRETPWEVEHISLARSADVFLIAPASANFLAKAAAGIADDMLTTTLLAASAPVLIAPAMNSHMFLNPAVQHNIEILSRRGFTFIEPGLGTLACGDQGVGRLADPEDIVNRTMKLLNPQEDMRGKRVLVTAGPTREDIDPVRYLSNRSTGRMGFAIARAAAARGAQVTLVSGPSALSTPEGVRRIDVISSRDMYDAVDSEFSACDVLIMAAAPADFTPKLKEEHKIKKDGGDGLTLELEPTKDILLEMGRKKGDRIVVGFAAETRNIRENALKKLAAKKLDMIAANDVSGKDTGFAAKTNALTVWKKDGTSVYSELITKQEAADWLLDLVMADRR